MASIDNVQDISPLVQYTATAAQVNFTYPFPIFTGSDLVVDIDGVIQVLTTDYTVSGAGNETGGTVTLVVGAVGGEIVTVYRDISIARDSDFQQNGPWSSVSTNDEFDKITLILQELENKIGRAIRFPITGAITNAQAELSPISTYAGNFLRITEAGLLEAAVALDNVVTLTAEVIGALLYPLTIAEDAASVTPVQFRYPESRVIRYALNTTPLTTNMTAAVTNAIAVNQNGGSAVVIPAEGIACGAVSVANTSKITIVGEAEAVIRETGTDVTFISPTGSIDISGVRFENQMIVVKCDSIALDSDVIIDECEFSETGDIDPVAGRTDFQGAISCGTAANKINKLKVTNCLFDGDDYGIAYRGEFKRAEVQHNEFRDLHRMAVMLGHNTGDQKEFEHIDVSHNYFKDIISNDAAEDEIHAVLSYGHRVIYHANEVDNCYDINASTHNSEALYTKAVFYTISDNHVIDGGRGNAFITVKGDVTNTADPDTLASGTAYGRDGSIRGNTVYATAAFEAAYAISTLTNGILSQSPRAIIADNTILGDFSRGIRGTAASIIHHNKITGDCENGIVNVWVDGDNQYPCGIDHNILRGDFTQGIDFVIASSTAGGVAVESVDINHNQIISTAAIVHNIFIDIGSATDAANVLKLLKVSDNILHGFNTGEGNGVTIATATGGLANNGEVTLAMLGGDIMDEVSNMYRLDGASGDVTAIYVDGCLNNNISNSPISNFSQATSAYVKGLRGQEISELSGTDTLANGTTTKTVTMGMDATLRPTSLEQITVAPIESLGSASFWWIDTLSADTFVINVNADPGADVDFVWQAKSLYG